MYFRTRVKGWFYQDQNNVLLQIIKILVFTGIEQTSYAMYMYMVNVMLYMLYENNYISTK
jgi:hypothetical protein